MIFKHFLKFTLFLIINVLLVDEYAALGQRTCYCEFHGNGVSGRVLYNRREWAKTKFLSCGEASLYSQKEQCETDCTNQAVGFFNDRNTICQGIGEANIIKNSGTPFVFTSSWAYSDCTGWRESERMRYSCCVPKCQCSIKFNYNTNIGVSGMGPEYSGKTLNLNIPQRAPVECGRDQDACRVDCRKAASVYLGAPELLNMAAVSDLNLLSTPNGFTTDSAVKLCSHINGNLPKPGVKAYLEFDNKDGTGKEKLFIGDLCCVHLNHIPGLNMISPYNCLAKKTLLI
jgi:hypothetical protein